MGSPKSRMTFWGEEEQRNEWAFRACTETNDIVACDDESTGITNIGFWYQNPKHKAKNSKNSTTQRLHRIKAIILNWDTERPWSAFLTEDVPNTVLFIFLKAEFAAKTSKNAIMYPELHWFYTAFDCCFLAVIGIKQPVFARWYRAGEHEREHGDGEAKPLCSGENGWFSAFGPLQPANRRKNSRLSE